MAGTWVRLDKERFFKRFYLMRLKQARLYEGSDSIETAKLHRRVLAVKRKANRDAEVTWNLMVTPWMLLDQERP